MDLFRVIKPGFFTTVQDLGRWGFQRFGVPVSGAMDKFAYTAANLLVDNQLNDASLEITLIGPELEALDKTHIAVTGADFPLTINGNPVAVWQTIEIEKGDIVAFANARNGCRAYLAIKGGIDVPLILGSRSTYVRSGFGGNKGRALKAGDSIQVFASKEPAKMKRILPSELVPSYDKEFSVDVVLGPQEDMFAEEGVETFLSHTYILTNESDRMGYRLDGPVVGHKGAAEIVTDPLVPGAVQVPGSGKPIVLMMDAQTTGGYPKIATVTTPDVSRLGQAKPGDKIRFKKVSLIEARARYLEFQASLTQLEERLVRLQTP